MKLKKLLYVIAAIVGIVGSAIGFKYSETAKEVIEVIADDVPDSLQVFKSESE